MYPVWIQRTGLAFLARRIDGLRSMARKLWAPTPTTCTPASFRSRCWSLTTDAPYTESSCSSQTLRSFGCLPRAGAMSFTVASTDCAANVPDQGPERMKFGSPRVVSSRSEEHTSELQSRQYLVCRLLLEKKNR